MNRHDLEIAKLGPTAIDSPLHVHVPNQYAPLHFVEDSEKVIFDPKIRIGDRSSSKRRDLSPILNINTTLLMESAGPRARIYFDPAKTKAAIVTCGGLCPGINDVIRGIVMELHYRYGVQSIYGVRYGYQGFIETYGHEPIVLTPDKVTDIHTLGGTLLGSSRGKQDKHEIVAWLERFGVQLLFVIGGDGTLRGALEISRMAREQGKTLSIVGIPKTIDNDIEYLDRSFGFQTAFSEAVKAIHCVNVEAEGVFNGVGLVKLMGRHSGFIACYAALAMNDANYVLIPEVPFRIEGKGGLLENLEERLKAKKHAVIVVAEGAGQELLKQEGTQLDASGNLRLQDIGLFLKQKIQSHFQSRGLEVPLKYIDPSYMIRSIPASPEDSVYCWRLAQNAVHAAMTGRTEMVVALRHHHYVHLPMALLAQGRKHVDPNGDLWFSVLEATGQPTSMDQRLCQTQEN